MAVLISGGSFGKAYWRVYGGMRLPCWAELPRRGLDRWRAWRVFTFYAAVGA